MSQPGRPLHLGRRQVLKIFGAMAAVGATGAAAACTSEPQGTAMEQPSGKTIKIGLISPALGPYSKIGDDIQKGFKLYLQDHNNLLGRHRVDLRSAEEGASPASAIAAAKDLLEQGVLALAGVANPASLGAIAPAIQTAKVPLVSANASPGALTSGFFIWRASHVEGEAGRALAPYARAGGETAFVLREDTPTAREEAAGFGKAFVDLKGSIIGESIGRGSFANRLQAARFADVIFASYMGADAVALLDAYRVSGLDAKLLGPGSLTETADLTKLTALPDNVFTSMYYAADLDNEENRRFVSSFHKVHGIQPSGYAMAAHDCASVLDKALHLVEGDPSPAALNQAFSLLGQIDSPRGTWTFNINRTPQQKWYLRKLRYDGQVAANLLDADLAVLS